MKYLKLFENIDSFEDWDFDYEEFEPIPRSENFIDFYGEILHGYRAKFDNNIAFVVKNLNIYIGEFDDNYQFRNLKKLGNFNKFKDVKIALKKAYELSIESKKLKK